MNPTPFSATREEPHHAHPSKLLSLDPSTLPTLPDADLAPLRSAVADTFASVRAGQETVADDDLPTLARLRDLTRAVRAECERRLDAEEEPEPEPVTAAAPRYVKPMLAEMAAARPAEAATRVESMTPRWETVATMFCSTTNTSSPNGSPKRTPSSATAAAARRR